MVGVGTWACKVDTMFFKGQIQFKITNENGTYGLEIEMDSPVPAFEIKSVREEGDSLVAVGTIEMLPGKEIEATLNFDGDTFDGVMKIPFLGKIKVKDGWRVS